MQKHRYRPPYHGSRTAFRHTWNKSGVYLIKENDRIVYIGESGTNLYRTLYRHFERWNHRGQPVVTYVNKMDRHRYTVRVVLCTPAQATRLERSLVLRHKPRDNENKYSQYTLKLEDRRILEQYDEMAVINTETPF